MSAQRPLAAPVRALVVAKAPVAGRVKTRLGADVGLDTAARLASAALLDTLEACRAAYGVEQCHVAMAGDPAASVEPDALQEVLRGWTVHGQHGDGFDQRLAAAHEDVAASGPGPVVQVGMDTPQLTVDLLTGVARGLDDHEAVLGPAEDGGWWVLALRDPAAAACLRGVPMSTPTTYDDTRAALLAAGLSVGGAAVLRDVDTVPDADAVAAAAPATRFARGWQEWRAASPADEEEAVR